MITRNNSNTLWRTRFESSLEANSSWFVFEFGVERQCSAGGPTVDSFCDCCTDVYGIVIVHNL